MQVPPDYDSFPRIETAFKAALDQSLNPRGPGMLYDMVAALGLASTARILDLGCGEGGASLELARRFGFRVLGVDPVPRHMELANRELDDAAEERPELRGLVDFELGSAESIPAPDASIDLIWCSEVLPHIEELDIAFSECRRVLRLGGRMLIAQVLANSRLDSREAAIWWQSLAGASTAANADPGRVEAALARSGFRMDENIELGGEWGERSQETTGEGGRRLLHAARLIRQPAVYVEQFGQSAYDIMLGDCLWHIYRMIGKLSGRIYLLTAV